MPTIRFHISVVVIFLFLSPFIQKEVVAKEIDFDLEVGFQSAENMVLSAEKFLSQVEVNHKQSESALKSIRLFIQFLENLTVSEIEQNRAHFDHLQKLKNSEFEALYWLGVYKIESNKWGEQEINQHLDLLRAKNSTAEYELIFLKELKSWPAYYKKNREVLELFEAFPEKLNLKTPLPPRFYEIDSLPINSLHDITVIIDIALKHYWMPEPSEFETLLLKISSAFQAKQAYRFAYEALQLMDESKRSEKIKKMINQLKQKSSDSSVKKTTSKALY